MLIFCTSGELGLVVYLLWNRAIPDSKIICRTLRFGGGKGDTKARRQVNRPSTLSPPPMPWVDPGCEWKLTGFQPLDHAQRMHQESLNKQADV